MERASAWWVDRRLGLQAPCCPRRHPHGLLVEIGKLASVTCVLMLRIQTGLNNPEKEQSGGDFPYRFTASCKATVRQSAVRLQKTTMPEQFNDVFSTVCQTAGIGWR